MAKPGTSFGWRKVAEEQRTIPFPSIIQFFSLYLVADSHSCPLNLFRSPICIECIARKGHTMVPDLNGPPSQTLSQLYSASGLENRGFLTFSHKWNFVNCDQFKKKTYHRGGGRQFNKHPVSMAAETGFLLKLFPSSILHLVSKNGVFKASNRKWMRRLSKIIFQHRYLYLAYVTSMAAEIYLISLFEGRQHVLADASNLPLSKVHVFHVIPRKLFTKFWREKIGCNSSINCN